MRAFRRFWCEEDGPTATEYAVLLALLLLVAIAGIQIHGTWMSNRYTQINALLN